MSVAAERTDAVTAPARGLVGLVGDTPLLELRSVSDGLPHRILGKCEFLNPGGSVKDRIGHRILAEAERAGLITPGRTRLVEATAGNTGVGLAVAAAGRYRLTCTMSSKMGPEKEALLRAWGAEVVRCPYEVSPDDPTSFINTAKRLAEQDPDAFFVDQFNRDWNVAAHYDSTGVEVLEQTGGNLAAFVAGVGTGGTLTGVARRLRDAGSPARIVLADPVGSVLAAAVAGRPQQAAPYSIEGIGGDFVPALFDSELVTDTVTVSDADAVRMCLTVAERDGVLVGGSSGCALVAARRFARSLPGAGRDIVVLLADGGDRYLSTIYDADWRRGKGIS
ncbi:cysteine synthase family protein [Micromonospora sp. NPDC023644]|uniref:PLP-dependent cysteine synthase family protein n=1 Tax=Micromonospora sp. NPDC023644 TaxID=3154321 RepID=UPI0033DFFE20